jgi:PAS domain S-box-containing protein
MTYGAMLAAVAVACLTRWLIAPVLGEHLPFFTFYFTTIFAAWYGGFWPGMVSLVLGTFCGMFFFVEPHYHLQLIKVEQLFDVVRYVAVSLCISLISEMLLRSQHSAERRREFLRTTLASIGDAVITTDAEGRVTGMNAVAESLTGWMLQEASGRPLTLVFKIINEHTREPVESPVMRALREGVIVGLANHTILLAKDRKEWPIDHSAAPIRDRTGKMFGCVLVFRDITERHEMENQLRQVAADLSAADRRKDEFLATLAHELRNPLAPIRNGLQVLKMAGGDVAVIEPCRLMMERQINQMVRLLDDLMDISRISRGKIELRKEQVPMAEVLNFAIESSRTLIEEMGHELTVIVPKTPIIVDADQARLAQVFMNLLNNSAKYSQRGCHIWITAERQGSDVVVSVRDTGIGIPTDKLTSVFDLFSQVDQKLDKSHGGLGIGLNIVKRLVEMHDGRIEAKSDGPGRGAEFVVRLPVVVEASVPTLADVEKSAVTRSSLRIQIVDDNRDAADSLAMMLTIMGNETRTAYDGQEGVELAGEFRPDVLLFDIGLPKLNGYEACRLIRQQPWGGKVVMIAVTGWGQEEDRQRSYDAGFDHHMVKPVDPSSLMTLLSELSGAKQ